MLREERDISPASPWPVVLASLLLGLVFSFAVNDEPVAYSSGPPAEVPMMSLPRSLREWNWGGGSCVHASNVMHLRWSHQYELAAWWRKTYSGGESYSGLTSKLNRNNVPFYATHSGDANTLERCTNERRGAVIFYYPNHSIWFCGFLGDKAYVLDNNRINSYIEIPKAEFLQKWRGFGGVAIVPTLGSPPPRLPYIASM